MGAEDDLLSRQCDFFKANFLYQKMQKQVGSSENMAQISRLLLLRLGSDDRSPIDREIIVQLISAVEQQIQAAQFRKLASHEITRRAISDYERTKVLYEKDSASRYRLQETQRELSRAQLEAAALGQRLEILQMKLDGVRRSLDQFDKQRNIPGPSNPKWLRIEKKNFLNKKF